MARMFALIVFLSALCPLEGGRTLRIGGKDFSFSITEPEGWMIDFAAAQQPVIVVLSEGTCVESSSLYSANRKSPLWV